MCGGGLLNLEGTKNGLYRESDDTFEVSGFGETYVPNKFGSSSFLTKWACIQFQIYCLETMRLCIRVGLRNRLTVTMNLVRIWLSH